MASFGKRYDGAMALESSKSCADEGDHRAQRRRLIEGFVVLRRTATASRLLDNGK
jgi:hypothetical protein